ncbi:MAG: Bug family tripartite tricarboxylate transporter substrate binding protein [Lautropia sp.]
MRIGISQRSGRRAALRALALSPLAASGGLLAPAAALAQAITYPSQTIKLVVPFAPGGGGDVLGRLLAERLTVSIGRPVIVENKPGASTVLGTETVVRAEPDGHTILLNVPLIVQTTALMAKLPYDPIRDLTPITDVVTTSLWLAVNPEKVKARTIPEFVAEMKAQPQKHSYGSIGQGSSTHLFGHALNQAANLDLVHVPYKGSSPAIAALIGGEISAVILDFVTLRPQVATGRIRLIGVTGEKRSPLTPDLPTFAEQGFAGFELPTWAGLWVPAKTPEPIVARLHDEFVKIMKQPEVVARFAELGYVPGGQPQQAFARQVAGDKERWTDLIRKAGVKID